MVSPTMGEHGGSGDGYRVLGMLLSGPVFYGGIGWLLDYWLHTSWIFPLGLIGGVGAGVYLVIARYGRSE